MIIKLSYTLLIFYCLKVDAILFPIETSSREVKDISGRWKFAVDNSSSRNESFTNKWWSKPLKQSSGWTIDMPVPASYNDITQEKGIRDFVGWAWLAPFNSNMKCNKFEIEYLYLMKFNFLMLLLMK